MQLRGQLVSRQRIYSNLCQRSFVVECAWPVQPVRRPEDSLIGLQEQHHNPRKLSLPLSLSLSLSLCPILFILDSQNLRIWLRKSENDKLGKEDKLDEILDYRQYDIANFADV